MQAVKIAPIDEGQRIWIMDALRGFAILGIFIANLAAFTFYFTDGPKTGQFFTAFDDEMEFLHHWLIEGKFYSIFSFLFGWGIALQLQRSSIPEKTNVGLIRRRLVIMFLLGLAHLVLIWSGDIVAFYALIGFVLIWMRKWRDRTLLITSIVLLLSPILLYYLKMQWSNAAAPSFFLWEQGESIGSKMTGVKSQEEYMNYVEHQSWWDNIVINVSGIMFRYADLFFQSRVSKVLGMFVLGYLIGRNYRFRNILSNKKLLWTLSISGLVIGLVANFIMVHEFGNRQAYYQLQKEGLYNTIFYALGVAPLSIGYMATFFLVARNQFGATLLQPLRPVGKMAFSNYILQSIIGTIVFTGVGFGMMGKVGPVYYTLFALFVFILQIIFSAIWLRYFEFGPVEWLWRSATYGKKQSVRKKNAE